MYKKDKTTMCDHIESFNPTISYFRWYHSPNVRYLPSKLSASWMLTDFQGKHPEYYCSYELYRKTLRETNIRFTKPQEDKCATCVYYELNVCDENCKLARKHNELQMTARKHYNAHCENYKNRDDTKIYAVDKQKVLLLSRMADIKERFFLSKNGSVQ